MKDLNKEGTLGRFYTLFIGQLLSVLGTCLTGFALGIWVLQQNNSTTEFSIIWTLNLLPSVLLAPFAGAIVDSMNRRTVLLLSDTGAALSTLVILLLVTYDNLSIWVIYVTTVISSSLNAFQSPAIQAAITQIVPREKLGRANGLMQLVDGSAMLLGPLLGGILLSLYDLKTILTIDLVSFSFAFISMLLIRIPNVTRTSTASAGPYGSDTDQPEKSTVIADTKVGARFLFSHKALLSLLLTFTALNFLTGMIMVLAQPYLLSLTDVKTLGIIQTIMGIGFLAGSMLTSITGGFKRPIHGILFVLVLSSVCFMLFGLTTNLIVISTTGFIFTAASALFGASSNTLWQMEVPEELQGRIFSFRRMIAMAFLPFAYLSAGPLNDYFFKPMMEEGGMLRPYLAWLFGNHTSPGFGLLFATMGFLTLLVSLSLVISPAWKLGTTPPLAPESALGR